MKRSISLLLLMALSVSACNLANPTEQAPAPAEPDTPVSPTSAPISQEPGQGEAPEDTATPEEPAPPPPGPVVVPPGDPIQHFSPGQSVTITYIDMFSPTDGWAIGGERDPGDHILLTSDGGHTWDDITPPEPEPTGEDPKVAYAYFLDADTAWVTYGYDPFFTVPEYPIVWFTEDGGESWTPRGELSGLGGIYNPLFFTFTDALHGWLLVHVDSGMSHTYVFLYRTQDGGATWERIIDPYSDNTIQLCTKTGMAFADADTGWITINCNGVVEGAQVIKTQDGGETWEIIELDLDPALGGGSFDGYCGTHSPHAFTSQVVIFGVNCKDFSGDTIYTYSFVYQSNDGGAGWDLYGTPGQRLLFLTPDQGFAFSDIIPGTENTRELYITQNSEDWELIRQVYWDGQFDFVDASYGWAVAREGDEIALVRTENGGADIELIEPVIAP